MGRGLEIAKHFPRAIAQALAGLEQSNPQQVNLERLRRLKSNEIISGSHNDELHL